MAIGNTVLATNKIPQSKEMFDKKNKILIKTSTKPEFGNLTLYKGNSISKKKLSKQLKRRISPVYQNMLPFGSHNKRGIKINETSRGPGK